MSRLAVMAHFDPRGGVGPHVRRQVQALAEAVDDVVVVSTAELTDESRRFLSAHSHLVERRNIGYDFFSYKTGLDVAAAQAPGGLASYDEVTICNDSYVGPLVPYADIFARMAERPVDFWGATVSRRMRPHVQSFFVTFRPWVVSSRAFHDFWHHMTPLSDRTQVIKAYEIGLTRALDEVGFEFGAYFEDRPDEQRYGVLRTRFASLHHRPLPVNRQEWRQWFYNTRRWNPAACWADRALDGGRLPLVKIDTLRYDPYYLGARDLLTMCEERFPDEFDGVRAYLDDTTGFYGRPPGMPDRPTPLALRPLRPAVAYRRPDTSATS